MQENFINMNDLKYLILSIPGMTTCSVVVFGGAIPHISMVPKGAKAVHGGFCTIEAVAKETILVNCFGEASSLGIKSNPVCDSIEVWKTITKNLSYATY